MRKKKWTTPQLVVLGKGRPEGRRARGVALLGIVARSTSLLVVCKAAGTPLGPNFGYNACNVNDLCSAPCAMEEPS